MTSFLNMVPKKNKTVEELVTSSKQCLNSIMENVWECEDDRLTTEQILIKNFNKMKFIICGDSEHPDLNEEKGRELSRVIQNESIFIQFIDKLDVLSFEIRKDTTVIFNSLMRRNINNFATVYVLENASTIIKRLCEGYMHVDSAPSCGLMLRECVRHESLARFILNSEYIWAFTDTYVHLPNFEVASDAFLTLKDLLTTPKNKQISCEFLDTQYDTFVTKYETLLQSDNYVTRRRSLKLLSELLVERGNYTVMMRYISSKGNLKTIMNLLKNKSANIQFETFHVFKIFVANPNKTREIAAILSQNQARLVAYLEAFHLDRDDPQFVDEKRLLIETLKQMEDLSGGGGSSSTSSRSGSRTNSLEHTGPSMTLNTTTSSNNSSSNGSTAGSSSSDHVSHGSNDAAPEPLSASQQDGEGLANATAVDSNGAQQQKPVLGVEDEIGNR